MLVLVPSNDPGAIPAKLFEYVRSGNRVLVLSRQPSEAGEIVRSLGCGEELPYDDFEGQKQALQRCFHLWRHRRLEGFGRFPQFERRSQAQRLAEVFERALETNG
ncbi:MAG: hypothetical protein AMJ46_14720 [Latescibacteria bacterium DG_63]|nr:MAG: hypothetical protein AMJ46_14720 [Latescibacteria bacterium DG_63]